MAEIRVCVVGDELVAGLGDARCLGWVGRVAARTRPVAPDGSAVSVGVFGLGVPGETTADLVSRWYGECERRFGPPRPTAPIAQRLVVALGRPDVYQHVSLPRSRLNLANVLDECAEQALPAFVVGPPPGPDDRLNSKIGELSAAFADVCLRRRVPYVDTFAPLVDHEDWLTDLATGDGRHPGQAGYGLMAWLVLHGGWHAFVGVAAD